MNRFPIVVINSEESVIDAAEPRLDFTGQFELAAGTSDRNDVGCRIDDDGSDAGIGVDVDAVVDGVVAVERAAAAVRVVVVFDRIGDSSHLRGEDDFAEVVVKKRRPFDPRVGLEGNLAKAFTGIGVFPGWSLPSSPSLCWKLTCFLVGQYLRVVQIRQPRDGPFGFLI